jgi:hypothetical protein
MTRAAQTAVASRYFMRQTLLPPQQARFGRRRTVHSHNDRTIRGRIWWRSPYDAVWLDEWLGS